MQKSSTVRYLFWLLSVTTCGRKIRKKVHGLVGIFYSRVQKQKKWEPSPCESVLVQVPVLVQVQYSIHDTRCIAFMWYSKMARTHVLKQVLIEARLGLGLVYAFSWQKRTFFVCAVYTVFFHILWKQGLGSSWNYCTWYKYESICWKQQKRYSRCKHRTALLLQL